MLPSHKVRINIADKRGSKQTVLQSSQDKHYGGSGGLLYGEHDFIGYGGDAVGLESGRLKWDR